VTLKPEQSKAQLRITGQLRLNFPGLITCAFALAALAAIFAANGHELTPEPKALKVWAEATGATLGALSFAVVMSVKPRTWRTLAMATCGSIVAALLCWMLSWIILSEIHQLLTFGRKTNTQQKDIPVIVAEITHHKGNHYNVWLEHYSALLEIDENDYVNAFGSAERLRPVGYCVRATVQTSGSASRILAKHGTLLPAGSVERCPSTRLRSDT
jgi:hypothetical protein